MSFGSCVTCKCKISPDQTDTTAIRTHEVHSVPALNVKELHSTIYFLNLPPSLFSSSSSPNLSSRRGSRLIATVDGCEERREEMARWWWWGGEWVWRRIDGVAFNKPPTPPPHSNQFSILSSLTQILYIGVLFLFFLGVGAMRDRNRGKK